MERFDWYAASDAKKLAFCLDQKVKLSAQQAKVQAKLDALNKRKRKLDEQVYEANEDHHFFSERIAGLNGHISRLGGKL